MIPVEILTLAGSGLLTAFVKFKSTQAKYQHELLKQALERSGQQIKNHDSASLRASDAVSALFRGIIVLSLMLVFVFPTISPLFGDWPIFMTWHEENRKILGLFGQLGDKMKFIELNGSVISPEVKHTMAAVIGYFFGSAAVK